MRRSSYNGDVELSQEFFDIVFQDGFIFAEAFDKNRDTILASSNLSPFEIQLAKRVANSELYTEENWAACDILCRQLEDVYPWQSNSEGPLIFASKIIYLLNETGRDAHWFKDKVAKPTKKTVRKKIRATVIVQGIDGFLITKSPKGEWLLPGGKKERAELTICAAARELYEETKLEAESIHFLFEHESQNYVHHVFLVTSFIGTARPSDDAIKLRYISMADALEEHFPLKLSRSNADIIRRYLAANSKNNQQA